MQQQPNRTFASVMQVLLIVGLTVSFLLIAQKFSDDVYRYGVLMLIVLTLIQIAFGNISPQANFGRSMVGLAITAVIIAAVVGLAIFLVPYLIEMGR
jgi:hypothetical protein